MRGMSAHALSATMLQMRSTAVISGAVPVNAWMASFHTGCATMSAMRASLMGLRRVMSASNSQDIIDGTSTSACARPASTESRR